jgi:hypothetical protein
VVVLVEEEQGLRGIFREGRGDSLGPRRVGRRGRLGIRVLDRRGLAREDSIISILMRGDVFVRLTAHFMFFGRELVFTRCACLSQ